MPPSEQPDAGAPRTAGWFADPTGRRAFRWWGPSGWTAHVWDDRGLGHDRLNAPWRRIVIGVSAGVAGLAAVAGTLMAMGDTDFAGRSGLLRHDGTLV